MFLFLLFCFQSKFKDAKSPLLIIAESSGRTWHTYFLALEKYSVVLDTRQITP
jgi:hypothetical protein